MTDRRRHPRWTQAERYLPPVRRSPWLALVAAGMMLLTMLAPARVADGVAAIPSVDEVTDKAQSGAAPPETARGLTRDGSAYVRTEFTTGPLLEFTVRFPLPNKMDRGWR